MSPYVRELAALHIVHVFAVLALFGCTFYAFAAPPATRKLALMNSGIAALVVLLSGLRLWQLGYGFALHGWIVVKILCWLGLSALAGLGYRRREHAGKLMVAAFLLVLVALVMVYVQPKF
jgi:hypothetical protein